MKKCAKQLSKTQERGNNELQVTVAERLLKNSICTYFNGMRDYRKIPLRVLEHSSSCCCSNPNEGTVYTVSVDVLTHAVDLHKTASR